MKHGLPSKQESDDPTNLPQETPQSITPTPIRGDFIPVSGPDLGGYRTKAGSAGYLSTSDADPSKAMAEASNAVTVLSPTHAAGRVAEAIVDTDPIKRLDESPRRSTTFRSPSPNKWSRENGPIIRDSMPQQSTVTRARSKSPAKSARQHDLNYYSARSRHELVKERKPIVEFALGPGPAPAESREKMAFGSIAERRQIYGPPPIDVQLAQQEVEGTDHAVAPVALNRRHPPVPGDGQGKPSETLAGRDTSRTYSSSVYSDSDPQSAKDDWQQQEELAKPVRLSPFRKSKDAVALATASSRQPTVLESYAAWKQESEVVMAEQNSEEQQGFRSPGKRTMTVGLHSDKAKRSEYTPLTPYFSTRDMPASKKASKTLIGDGGWLERTGATPEKKVLSPKKVGFLESLKKKAREIVADKTELSGARHSRMQEAKDQKSSNHLSITMAPREQSLLYCEMEFLLTSALDGYITSQFNAGRLDTDKLKKISDLWLQKGRPKVVGFRYDLETQLDLIRLHSSDFKFYGRQATMAHINTMIDTMRVNARAIRIRTFCQPDSVIAKQLLDSQALLEMLACPSRQQIQLAEVVGFFKVVLEREQHYRTLPRENRNRSPGHSPTRNVRAARRKSDHDARLEMRNH